MKSSNKMRHLFIVTISALLFFNSFGQRSSSIFTSDIIFNSDVSDHQFNRSFRSYYEERSETGFAPPVNLPGKIQAESWDAKSGSQYAVATNDVGGGQHVVGIANGNYMDYNVNVTGAGTYTVNFRVATTQAHAQFQIKSGASILGTINVPNTGDWGNWQTTSITNVSLSAGAQTIRVQSSNNESCNFNWFEFVATSVGNLSPTANAGSDQSISLPSSSVSLVGTASDADGTITSYAWSQVGGTTATITSPGTAATTITGLTTVGARVFRLIVTDNNGATGVSEVTVTVTGAPGLPNVTTNGPQSITISSASLTSTGAGNGGIGSTKWTKFSVPGQGLHTVTVIGSSTAAGNGVTSGDSSFVNRLKAYYVNQGIINDIINLSVAGTSPFDYNITTALNYNSEILLVSYPSNGYTASTNAAALARLQLFKDSCDNRGVDFFITGTQPRNDFSPADRANLIVMNDSLRLRFGNRYIDFLTPLLDVATNNMKPEYYADGIHPNNAGHEKLYQLVKAANIFQLRTSSTAVITTPNSTNTTVTGLTNGTHKFQVAIIDNQGFAASAVATVVVNIAGNQPPTANAGTNQTITLPTSSTTLTGTGSDADGSVAGYVWSQTGGTAATITTPGSASTTITGLTTAGIRTFRLTVTDNQGATGISEVTITVNDPANTPPTANAGVNQTITLPTSTASLTGSGSDVDGTISSYLWSQVSGTAATITTPGSASTTITGLTSTGSRVFKLTVTDNAGATGTANVTITVNPGNQSPVANAGSNQTITQPASSVTLTGSGTDADGSISSYAWSQVSGTATTITTPGAASTTVTGMTTVGTRVFRLTVTDNNGASGTSDVTIVVNPLSNGKTIPGRIQTENWDVKSGGLYAVNTNDVGGGQHVVGIANGNYMDYNVTVTSSGTYTVTFRIATTQLHAQFQIKLGATVLGTINIPNTGDWGTWQTVIGPNIPLVAGVQTLRIISTNNESCNFNWFEFAPLGNLSPTANAGSNQTITLPTSTVSLTGMGTDPDGTVNSYAWTQTGGTAATITTPGSASTTITGLTTAGIRTFRLTVTDNEGAIGTSDVTITVNDPANILPTANAGSNQSITLPASTVALTGSGTDADGTVTTYLWSQVSGTAATITTPGAASTTITGLTTAGARVFKLTVTDNAGGQGTSNVTVTVNPGNQLPVANAGSNQTIVQPASSVSLTGSGTDPDGTISSYAWSQISGTAATITTPGAASTIITGLTTVGVRVFRLTVTDNNGATGISDVTITVNPLSNGKTIPGRIETENWDVKSGGMYAVSTNDVGGGLHVVGIANNNYMDYNVTVSTTGTYSLSFRTATTQNNSQFQLKLGATILGTISIPNTGDWGTWRTVTINNINLTAGVQTLRIQSTNTESCNFNWFEMALISGGRSFITNNNKKPAEATSPETIQPLAVYPNPFADNFNLSIPLLAKDNIIVTIHDLNGNQVYQKKFTDLQAGNNVIRIIPGSKAILISGIYFVKVLYLNNNEEKTFKLFKQ